MGLKKLLSISSDNTLSGVKWHVLKQSIVKCLLLRGDTTIAELSAELQSSIPTVTKAVNELLAEGLVLDLGKVSNSGGRRPSLYSLAASSSYFLGVEVNRANVSIGLQDVKNEFVSIELGMPFALKNSSESINELCDLIQLFIKSSKVDKSKIAGACVNFSGRVNSVGGFCSNNQFNENQKLADMISARLHMPVYLENDTRAMTFGEFSQGVVNGEQNIIFLNYGWGVAIGIITNGKLYYGKSGYSGEFGHSALFDNDKLCYCGKVGCLETEVSGLALVEQFEQAIAAGRKSLVQLSDDSSGLPHESIIKGVLELEDNLCIDLISKQSEKMGQYLSILLNLFNPELLIVGGDFSQLGDFVLLPIQASLRKHSVNLVNRDMVLKKSALGNKAGIIGACQIVKEKMLSSIM